MTFVGINQLAETSDPSNQAALLKQYIESIDKDRLPLQQGLSQSSYVSEAPFTALILSVQQRDGCFVVKTGIQYKGIVAGCNCADDPSGVPELDEYCEMVITINPVTGATEVALASEPV